MQTQAMRDAGLGLGKLSINAHKLGLTLGVVFSGWHLAWSALVFLGWGQGIIDFIFWLHLIAPPYQVGAFAWSRAIGLVMVTTGLGYIVEYVSGVIWNALHRMRMSEAGEPSCE
jgi:hypothetical protein